MAEENVVTETIEASGNNEAIIKTIEEKNEQETQQLAKETTEDTVPQSSAVEGDHSEAADEKAKTDALVEHGDGGDKNEVGSSTKVATEPNASIDATDDEEATRGEEPQISPGEDKEVRIFLLPLLDRSYNMLMQCSLHVSIDLNCMSWYVVLVRYISGT